jgi:hypothetical protein
MNWELHYQKNGEQFRVPADNRMAAIAVACILLRDGHDVMKLESIAGEKIETNEIKRLCER